MTYRTLIFLITALLFLPLSARATGLETSGGRGDVHSERNDTTSVSLTREALAFGHLGLKLYSEKRYDAALEKFSQAEQLAHSPVFVLYQGRSCFKLGRLLEARRYLRSASQGVLKDSAPSAWKSAVRDAKRELHEVREAVPQVRVRFVGDVEFPVQVQMGSLVVEAQSPVSSIEVDPGSYTLIARDATGSEVSQLLRTRSGSQTVHVQFSFSRRETPVSGVVLPKSEPSVALKAPSRLGPWRRGSVAALSGSGAAFLLAGVTYGVAVAKAKRIRNRCEAGVCPSSIRLEQYEARRWANLSTAGVVVGVLSAATGVSLWMLGEKLDGGVQIGVNPSQVIVSSQF